MRPTTSAARLRDNLRLRSEILSAVRQFFNRTGYVEVETPCRIPAPAPEAHIDAESAGAWFLQTSPELCMKRMLAGGFSRIYQICKCFRRHERGTRHLPEMTLLEWYRAPGNYTDLMAQCQDLIRHVADVTGHGDHLTYQGRRIALGKPWQRITVQGAFKKYASVSLVIAMQEERFDEIMACEIEPHLGIQQPAFLIDYPAKFASLAKTKPEDPTIAERFELYIAGIELCNAFTELTDPLEQRRRFEDEIKVRQAMAKPVYPLPEKFLSALEQMPEAAGCSLGIDRLVMLLAGARSIDDVVAFTPEDL